MTYALIASLSFAADLTPAAETGEPAGVSVRWALDARDGSLGTPEGRDVAEAADGGGWWLGALGETGREQPWLARIGPDGRAAWARRYEPAVGMSPWQVVDDGAGGALVIGSLSASTGDDVGVLRVGPDGSVRSLWRYGLDGSGREQVRDVARLPDGGLVMVGDVVRGDETLGLVLMVDASGGLRRALAVDADPLAGDALLSVTAGPGVIVAVGRSHGSGSYPTEAGWVLQLDGAGAVQRSALMVDLCDDLRLSEVIVDAAGLVVAGTSAGSRPLVARVGGGRVEAMALDGSGRTLGLSADGGALLWTSSTPRWTAVGADGVGGTLTLDGVGRRWRAVGGRVVGMDGDGALLQAAAGGRTDVGAFAVDVTLEEGRAEVRDDRGVAREERVDVSTASLPVARR